MKNKWEDFFYLDPTTPSGLRWKVTIYDSKGRATKAQEGVVAGSLSGQGRYQVKVAGKVVRCHRVIWEMLHGEIPEGLYVDHEDGDCANNNHDNLVLKTPKGNQQNKGSSGRNTSGVTGVSFWTSPQTGCEYARAYVGKKYKTVSVLKHGREEAFRLACEARDRMLLSANKNGAQYTERHGREL